MAVLRGPGAAEYDPLLCCATLPVFHCLKPQASWPGGKLGGQLPNLHPFQGREVMGMPTYPGGARSRESCPASLCPVLPPPTGSHGCGGGTGHWGDPEIFWLLTGSGPTGSPHSLSLTDDETLGSSACRSEPTALLVNFQELEVFQLFIILCNVILCFSNIEQQVFGQLPINWIIIICLPLLSYIFKQK